MIEIVEAVADNGEAPYATWRSSLDLTTRARVAGALLKLAQGNFSSVKGVGGGVFEVRMHFGAGYRIYFGKDGDTLIVLLGGGSKQRQQNDIAAAQELWRRYKKDKTGK